MKTRTPYALPYSNIRVEHKLPRSPVPEPPKRSTDPNRCVKFWCESMKTNLCCRHCLYPCDSKCRNDTAKCSCITDEIHGKMKLITIWRDIARR